MLSGWPRRRVLTWITLASAAGFLLCFLLVVLTGMELDSAAGLLGAVFGGLSLLLTALQLFARPVAPPAGDVADDLAAGALDLAGRGRRP
ncbi:hypothetical protein AB0M02_23285 [Actinoplanes sp. NPDC051861]|uniref:hypothetical protein n=1 Tax=Actinoplanes sp. NPDC051861 TaxID=3155170 RepID=UPI0034451A6D